MQNHASFVRGISNVHLNWRWYAVSLLITANMQNIPVPAVAPQENTCQQLGRTAAAFVPQVGEVHKTSAHIKHNHRLPHPFQDS